MGAQNAESEREKPEAGKGVEADIGERAARDPSLSQATIASAQEEGLAV
eukprot:CAMPEP_0180530928 /NCGR_PEP_ID=MMETSP1036_2-20121128/62209_1 /TAXON_ID=632150 /ORGANISM="Azadinium spinosum, Strain 3D9" /LENGTH=48 /DNA_ID= /DNA_START= /DNA_END= /DNA_ORIENTATION=